MSHAGHYVIRCADCGAVLRQCRCPGPKPTVYRQGPCQHCERGR